MSSSKKIKIADCTSKRLLRVALQSGFNEFQGTKHYKIKTKDGRFITTIPRHSRIKKELARAIVQDLNKFGADIEII